MRTTSPSWSRWFWYLKRWRLCWIDLRLPRNLINCDKGHRHWKTWTSKPHTPSVHNLSNLFEGEQALEVALGQVETLFLNSNFVFHCSKLYFQEFVYKIFENAGSWSLPSIGKLPEQLCSLANEKRHLVIFWKELPGTCIAFCLYLAQALPHQMIDIFIRLGTYSHPGPWTHSWILNPGCWRCLTLSKKSMKIIFVVIISGPA